MKIILLIISLILGCAIHAQNVGVENFEKCWKYRDQLWQRFMRIGNGEGYSILANQNWKQLELQIVP